MPEPASFLNAEAPKGELAGRYLAAMLSREANLGRELIMRAVERGESIKDIYLNVFQPVMYEIGRLWQTGKISVGQEHYCTNATQVTMSMLYPLLFKNPGSGKRMIAACVQGELHELGLRMVADFFEMDGWNTDYLGANTPHESIIREIEEKSAEVLAIGITMYYHLEKVQSMIDAVRRATGAGKIKILLGGYTIKIDETLWRTLGADGTARNAQDAIALANKLTSAGSAVGTPDSPTVMHKPVSPVTLGIFDAAVAAVEEEVMRQCMSGDHPEITMGPGAAAMTKNGLGFITGSLRTSMVFGAAKIVENQIAWSEIKLPGYGVSMAMVLKNFERYNNALMRILTPEVYGEVRPYLADLIKRQRGLVKDADGTDAG